MKSIKEIKSHNKQSLIKKEYDHNSEISSSRQQYQQSSEHNSSEDQQDQIQESKLPQSQSQENQSSTPPSQLRSSDLEVGREYDEAVDYDVGHYKMQKILRRRWNLQKKQFQYLIKWKGWSLKKHCTWENTQNIIGEPYLQLKDLGGESMLARFERTHAQTLIYDQSQKRVVKKYFHNEANHQKYAPKKLIDNMERQLKQLYGSKEQQGSQNKIKYENESRKIKEQYIESKTFSERKNIKTQQSYNKNNSTILGYKFKDYTVQKVVFYSHKFQVKFIVSENKNPDNKQLKTCDQIMSMCPQTGILCWKAHLSLLSQWEAKHLPKK